MFICCAKRESVSPVRALCQGLYVILHKFVVENTNKFP